LLTLGGHSLNLWLIQFNQKHNLLGVMPQSGTVGRN